LSKLAVFGGNPVRKKPFPSWPVFDQSEENAVLGVLRSGQWWNYSFGAATTASESSGDHGASSVGLFQQAFAKAQGATYGVACANGTAALEVALRALGVGPGDEVIVPPYTFVATATAPLQVNALTVFCDINSDTFNLDPRRMEQAINPRTKAVIPVHFAGLAADMESILEIARRHNLRVIEDAAHGHGGSWQNRGLGSIGDAGTFSFQASKNMTAGEGGIIITDDKCLAERCESYIWAGRKAGHAWYKHFQLGWNYRITEFQAAILIEQLKRVEQQTTLRNRNAQYLKHGLKEIPGIYVTCQPVYATRHAHHIFVLRFREDEFGLNRDLFLTALEQEGVPCSSGYAFPLYKNPMFLNQEFGGLHCSIDYRKFEELCPVAEKACREAIWLEHRLLLGDLQDMDDIVRAFQKVYEFKSEFARANEAQYSPVKA
jgi:dTDP-4-amino-4,6-dideoxygalactose transaminase